MSAANLTPEVFSVSVATPYDSFTHESLDGDQSVRLLTINPGTVDEPIHCSLHCQPLGEDHACLSYAWGDGEATECIIINGKSFFVRQNLWKFLCTARRYGVQSPLWIDALCINQSDDEEKSRQVRLMSAIYSRATSVIIWLGLDDEECYRLLQLQDFLEGRSPTHDSIDYSTDAASIRCWTNLCKNPLWARLDVSQRIELLTPFSKARTDGYQQSIDPQELWKEESFRRFELTNYLCRILPAIASNQYWNRVWIVQETVLAKHPRILSPGGPIELTPLIHLMFHYGNNRGRWSRSSAANFASLNSLLGPRLKKPSFSQKTPKCSLSLALEATRYRECSDVRDRVYATLSLVNRSHLFKVDYTNNVDDILWNTIEFELWHGNRWEKYKPFSTRLARLGNTLQSAINALRIDVPQPLPEHTIWSTMKDLGGFHNLSKQVYWTGITNNNHIGRNGCPESGDPRAACTELCIPIFNCGSETILAWPVQHDPETGLCKLILSDVILWKRINSEWRDQTKALSALILQIFESANRLLCFLWDRVVATFRSVLGVCAQEGSTSRDPVHEPLLHDARADEAGIDACYAQRSMC